MKNKVTDLNEKLNKLTVFRSFLDTPVAGCFATLAEDFEIEADEDAQVFDYCELVSQLYQTTADWSSYMKNFVLTDENFYVRNAAAGKTAAAPVEKSIAEELVILQQLCELRSEEVISMIGTSEILPDWENSEVSIADEFNAMIEKLPVTGYGIYAKYHAFNIKDGKITPVKYPDAQKLSQLFKYKRERDLIIKNTEALLSGDGASNVLLYGDAGTGKSSTIKAVANAYADRGLRLIEVKKNQLFSIPDIVEELSANPLKFILFIDDLSFTSNDDNFSALKAVLEGSVSSFGDNVAIYATSNRRHLIKESMDDRNGDELYVNDTLQELMSLAARFGLTITYNRPDKDTYLEIVDSLAKEFNINLPEDELHMLAERHAIRCNGRSPRVAKQFIELQKNGLH